MQKLNKWRVFLNERFCLIQNIPMVTVFVLAHVVFFSNKIFFSLENILLIFITVLFFLKLRLFDEIKDYETDKKIHKNRPLPRGLITITDLKIIIFSIIFLEILFFSYYGIDSFLMIFITIVYSLLMFKEFFVKNWIRKYLTFYAISHTIVVSFFSLSIFTIFVQGDVLNFDLKLYYFSLSVWFMFNLFEFSRKTFSKIEERKKIDSYSKNFGLFGALVLSLVDIGASLSLMTLSSVQFENFAIIIFILTVIFSLLFLWREKFSKLYRFYTIFIIFIIYFLFLF